MGGIDRARRTAGRRSSCAADISSDHVAAARRRARRSRAPSCWPGSCRHGVTTVIEPAPTRDHSERAFPAFGLRRLRPTITGTSGTVAVSVEAGSTPPRRTGLLARAGRSVDRRRLGGRGGGAAGVSGGASRCLSQPASPRFRSRAGADGRDRRLEVTDEDRQRTGRDDSRAAMGVTRRRHRSRRGPQSDR